MMRVIDVMVNSASRPFLLKRTLPTMIKHLRFNGLLRWIFHEAVLFRDLSDECLSYAEWMDIFDDIQVTNDPKGETISIGKVLDSTVSKYLVHIEDDFEFTRNVDLDVMWDIFESSGMVNQIVFNRRQTMSKVSGWKKGEFEIAGHTMTTSPHWRYTPAMWRLNFIKPKWQSIEGSNGHWKINDILQGVVARQAKTPEWVAENLGTFYYGPIGEPAFCRHIGAGYSNRMPT